MLFAADSVWNASWKAQRANRVRAKAIGMRESCFLMTMISKRITNAASWVSSLFVECADAFYGYKCLLQSWGIM